MTKRTMKKILVLFAFILLVSGCTTIKKTTGMPIDEALVDELTRSIITRQDVINTFGQPTEVRFKDTQGETEEEELIYIYKVENTPTYAGGIVEDRRRTVTNKSTLTIQIKDGQVSHYSYKVR